MIFDDDDEDEDFSFGDDEKFEEPPAPEPLSNEDLPSEYTEPPQQENGDTWLCSCGQENVGDFCVACGKPRNQAEPSQQENADTWLCSCGQENVGDFCVTCGKPKNQAEPSQQENADTWLCSCGQENVGDFCVACGKPKNQAEEDIRKNLRDISDEINRQRRRSAQSEAISSPSFNSENVNQPPPQSDFNNVSPPPTLPSSADDNFKKYIAAAIGAVLILGTGFFAFQSSQDDKSEESAEIATSVPIENTKVIATYYVVNCNQSVTLRSMPSTNSVELAQVPFGQAVGFIEETNNGFCKVNHAGRVGYISSQYLSAEKPAPVTAPPVQSTPSPANNNNSILSLGGISLGDSIEKMHNILGREDRITGEPTESHHEYRDVVITYNGRRITGIVSYSPAVKTERGIREGVTLQ